MECAEARYTTVLRFVSCGPGAPANCTNANAWCYDAAGNLLNDGVSKLTYDAENRIISSVPVGGGIATTYMYDAEGRRIQMKTGSISTDYVYDIAGRRIADVSESNATLRTEVYAGDRHIATYESGTIFFAHTDWLGTERARTTSAGVSCRQNKSLPFGDGLTSTGGCYATPQMFTGKEHDSETRLEYFGARYYSNSSSRFVTVDRLKETNHPADPQSLNLYSYTLNNPVRFVDSKGFCTAPPVGSGQVGICIETFIASRWIGGVGRGDGRKAVGNDPKATFRTHQDFVIDLKSHTIVSQHHDAGVSGIIFKSLGLKGSETSNVKSNSVTANKDGVLSLTVLGTGQNGLWFLPGSPEGHIEHAVTLVVYPDGRVALVGGIRRGFPSLEIWYYDDKGRAFPVVYVPEGKQDDLKYLPNQELSTFKNGGNVGLHNVMDLLGTYTPR